MSNTVRSPRGSSIVTQGGKAIGQGIGQGIVRGIRDWVSGRGNQPSAPAAPAGQAPAAGDRTAPGTGAVTAPQAPTTSSFSFEAPARP